VLDRTSGLSLTFGPATSLLRQLLPMIDAQSVGSLIYGRHELSQLSRSSWRTQDSQRRKHGNQRRRDQCEPAKPLERMGYAAAAIATFASMTSFNDRAAKAQQPRPSSVRASHPQASATRAAVEASDTSHSEPRRALLDRSTACRGWWWRPDDPRVPSDEPSPSFCRLSEPPL